MNDIGNTLPFVFMLPLLGLIYWPVTLGLAALLGWEAARQPGITRVIHATLASILLVDLAGGLLFVALR